MLTATWSANANLLQLTQPELIKRVLAETGMGTTGTTTSTGDSTSVIDATNLKNAQKSSSLYVGGWVRITSGDCIGEISPISSYDPSTGDLTLATALTGAPGSGATYEIWLTNFSPAKGIEALTRLLTEMYYVPTWTFLTEVPDGDMEQSGVGEWSDTNATSTKVSAQVGVQGRQALKVTTSSANGYTTNANYIRVKPGSSLLCAVNYTPNSATATTTGVFTIWDETNGAAIESITSVSKATVRLYKQVSVPPTCSLIRVRMGSQENSVATIWDELSVLDQESASLPLPWWVKRPGQVKAFFDWRPVQAGAEQYEFEAAYRGVQSRRYEMRPDHAQPVDMRAVAKYGNTVNSFIFGVRNETAYASLTASKPLDENWVTAGLAYQFMMLQSANVGSFSIPGKEHETKMKRFLDAWNAARVQQTKECRAPMSGRPHTLIEV